jgi:hypothetical protein
VTFRWANCAHGSKQKLMKVTAAGAKPGCRCANNYGGWLLAAVPTPSVTICSRALWRCARCGDSMILVQRFTAEELNPRWVARSVHVDSL